jgi:hypothetical protein
VPVTARVAAVVEFVDPDVAGAAVVDGVDPPEAGGFVVGGVVRGVVVGGVVRGVVVGGLVVVTAAVTTTVPCMNECTRQKYAYVPGVENVCE